MRKLLIVSALLLTFAQSIGSSTKLKVSAINSPVIGPFEKFQDDTQLEFNYKLSSTVENMSEKIRVSNPKDNKLFYISSTTFHKVTYNKEYNVSFPLKTHSYFGSDGFNIEITINHNSDTLLTYNITFYPIDSETINVFENTAKEVKSKTVAFKLSVRRIATFEDDFNFVDFKNYVDADIFYSLDINGFSFLYNDSNFEYDSAYLLFPDPNNVFKYFDHVNGNVNLQLEIISNGQTKRFKYKNPFYVNRLNLETSSYYIPGFEQASKLYLPVNSKEKLLGTEFQIVIKNCGMCKYTFVFDITYDIFRELIGNCYSSDYCIRGEAE